MVKTSASSAGGVGLITGLGTKIPDALWYSQKLFKGSLEEVASSLIIQFTSVSTTLRIPWIELGQELTGGKRRWKRESIKAKAVDLYLKDDYWEVTDT